MFVNKKNKSHAAAGEDCLYGSTGLKDCLKRVVHGATAPEWASRLQPVCGRNRLKPGRLGRCPVDQGTPHAVGPPRIIFSDSL